MYQRKERMKNDFQNKIWTIWISDYAVWTNKYIDDISRIDQSCVIWLSEQICDCISEWHSDIL